MEGPEVYKDHEQSYIKHRLLEAYLEKLFMIIGQHEQRICYVDCMAGPWKESNEALTGTSIALSLEVMEKCHKGLSRMFNRNVEFRALFIEKDKKAYKKLDIFLQRNTWDGVKTKSEQGDFYKLRTKILEWCGRGSFTFFFIDPTGWKKLIEIPTLSPLLERPNSEFLINFMYDFVLRVHPQKNHSEDMSAVFGEVPDTSGMSPKEKESYLRGLYIAGLKGVKKSESKSIRSAYVTIKDPIKERTKYHLVYLSRHPLGIIKFMEVSEKLDIVQKKVRARTKQDQRIQKTGQQEMWSADFSIEDNDNSIDLEVVKDYWLDKLTTFPVIFGNDVLADMLEETNWFAIDFQRAFKELEDEGKVENLDATGKRTKHFIHFKQNERLRRT